MFVFTAIKEVLLVFILSIEAFNVFVKNVPVVSVEVKVNVEILLVRVLEFKMVEIAFTVTFVELILTFVE